MKFVKSYLYAYHILSVLQMVLSIFILISSVIDLIIVVLV